MSSEEGDIPLPQMRRELPATIFVCSPQLTTSDPVEDGRIEKI
jgi:hypothetical protein